MLDLIMLFVTYIYQNTSAGSCSNTVTMTNITGLYTCAAAGLGASSGYNFALGFGLSLFFFILITGVLANRGVEIVNGALAGGFFSLVMSLFLQQLSLVGSFVPVLWVGIVFLTALISMMRGSAKPYG